METSARVTPSHLLEVSDTQIQENIFALKNTQIAEEAVSANKEAAATFLRELRKLIIVRYYPWFQAFTGAREMYLHG